MLAFSLPNPYPDVSKRAHNYYDDPRKPDLRTWPGYNLASQRHSQGHAFVGQGGMTYTRHTPSGKGGSLFGWGQSEFGAYLETTQWHAYGFLHLAYDPISYLKEILGTQDPTKYWLQICDKLAPHVRGVHLASQSAIKTASIYIGRLYSMEFLSFEPCCSEDLGMNNSTYDMQAQTYRRTEEVRMNAGVMMGTMRALRMGTGGGGGGGALRTLVLPDISNIRGGGDDTTGGFAAELLRDLPSLRSLTHGSAMYVDWTEMRLESVVLNVSRPRWSTMASMLQKIGQHVCGHANVTDIEVRGRIVPSSGFYLPDPTMIYKHAFFKLYWCIAQQCLGIRRITLPSDWGHIIFIPFVIVTMMSPRYMSAEALSGSGCSIHRLPLRIIRGVRDAIGKSMEVERPRSGNAR